MMTSAVRGSGPLDGIRMPHDDDIGDRINLHSRRCRANCHLERGWSERLETRDVPTLPLVGEKLRGDNARRIIVWCDCRRQRKCFGLRCHDHIERLAGHNEIGNFEADWFSAKPASETVR